MGVETSPVHTTVIPAKAGIQEGARRAPVHKKKEGTVMAVTTIDGLISNLDTTKIIEALLYSYKAPAERLATRRDATTSKISAVQGLSASVLSVKVAAENLGKAETFRSRSITSTNNEIVSATATSASEPGTFTVSVQQLAAAQQLSSDPDNVFTSNTTALNLDGQLRINNTTISLRTGDTLRDVAARITNSSAGVSASVIEVETGKFRLSLRAKETGATGFTLQNVGTANILEDLRLVDPASDTIANTITNGAASYKFSSKTTSIGTLLGVQSAVPAGSITIANGVGSINVGMDLATQSLETIAANINSAAGTAGSAITASVVESPTGSFRLEILSGDGTTPTFTDANNTLEALGIVKSAFTQVDQTAKDAQFKVNGIAMVRSTNTISNVMTGITLTLSSQEEPAEEVTIGVQEDSSAAIKAVQLFVDAYNSTKSFGTKFASYDSESQKAGILLGDSAMLSVDSTLSGLLFRSISTLPSKYLSELNNGGGVASGSIKITDRAGTVSTIDLSSADTIQEALTFINVANVAVEATVNRAGTGIQLRDLSGGNGTLTIEEVSGGTTAADLGILGSSAGTTYQGASIATAEFMNFGQLGILVNSDGSLRFNSNTFEEYLTDNPEAVQAFFTQKGGFGEVAARAIDSLTNSRNGILTTRTTSLQDSVDSYNQTIKRIEDRSKIAEERLRRQFTNLEESLAKLQEQSAFLASQLGQTTNTTS
jgi:flagellar hook-associated protein 2